MGQRTTIIHEARAILGASRNSFFYGKLVEKVISETMCIYLDSPLKFIRKRKS
jgi:hypothetical protein